MGVYAEDLQASYGLASTVVPDDSDEAGNETVDEEGGSHNAQRNSPRRAEVCVVDGVRRS